MSGLGCEVSTGAEACARWEAGALFRASHSGGEVAAAELGWAAWQGEERSSARGSGSRRSLGCRVGRWAKQEEACGLPRRRAAPAAVKQRGREVEEDCWVFLQIPKSLGIPL